MRLAEDEVAQTREHVQALKCRILGPDLVQERHHFAAVALDAGRMLDRQDQEAPDRGDLQGVLGALLDRGQCPGVALQLVSLCLKLLPQFLPGGEDPGRQGVQQGVQLEGVLHEGQE